MSSSRWWCAVVCGLAVAGSAAAQTATKDPTCPRTRAEVRAECIEFLKTHEWSEPVGDWVVKGTTQPATRLPEGVTPRAKIRAELDAFLRANRWNDANAQWEPIKGAPREVSTLSRAQVKKETEAFMRTHRWDEETETYVLLGVRRGKGDKTGK